MKIIYLHQYFLTPQMSGGTRSYEMARRLVAAGHEVHMVTTDRTTAAGQLGRWKETTEDGIRVHWLALPYANTMSYAQRIMAFFKFAISSSRKAASLGGDVVFATSTPLTIALPGIHASRRNRIPMVFEVRDLWPEMPIAVGALKNPLLVALAGRLEKAAYFNAKHVVALSPGMADGVVKTGYPAEKVTVIPNCCDVAMFDVPAERGLPYREKLGLAPGQPLVVYCGSFGLLNDIEYMVKMAAQLRDSRPDVRFLIVGQGARNQAVRELASQLGVLDRNLHIWDPLPKAEMPNLLAAATVATSLFIPLEPMWVNSANKFFDGLAAGKPMAINYGGWQADALRETGAGVMLTPGKPEVGARELAAFLADGPGLERAAAAARELAVTRFDRDEMARQLEAVLCAAKAG